MAEVGALAGEWDGLLGRTASPEIFGSSPWITSWWDVFGKDDSRRPLVIGARQGKTLVGIAPFVVREKRLIGGKRVRRLEFMGTGEDENDEVCSDFLDVVAAPGFEDQVAGAIWGRLREERPRWDIAVFRNVLGGSVLARFVAPMLHDMGGSSIRRPSGERFWVDLAGGDFNAYVEGLSKKKKKRIFYYRRKLEKEGGVVEHRLGRREDIPQFLREIARLSCLRRNLQGMPSAWQSEKFRRFHEIVAPRLWELGQLDLRLWMKDGRAVAALYNFLFGGTIYYYQSGFDTAAFGNISPGLVTISHVIEWGFTHKQRRYDFLVGAEGSYKEDYACQTETAYDLTFYNTTGTGLLLRSVQGVRDFLATARARLEAAEAEKADKTSAPPAGPRAAPEAESDIPPG